MNLFNGLSLDELLEYPVSLKHSGGKANPEVERTDKHPTPPDQGDINAIPLQSISRTWNKLINSKCFLRTNIQI